MRVIIRSLPWLLCIALGVSIGMSVFTFYYAEGASYLSNDPKACVNCHIMQDHYDSWIKSSHRTVAGCNDCHVPHAFPEKYFAKFKNGWNHSRAFTLQDFQEPIRITAANLKALQHNCMECHTQFTGHIAGHREAELGTARCTECHRSVGHMSSS